MESLARVVEMNEAPRRGPTVRSSDPRPIPQARAFGIDNPERACDPRLDYAVHPVDTIHLSFADGGGREAAGGINVVFENASTNMLGTIDDTAPDRCDKGPSVSRGRGRASRICRVARSSGCPTVPQRDATHRSAAAVETWSTGVLAEGMDRTKPRLGCSDG